MKRTSRAATILAGLASAAVLAGLVGPWGVGAAEAASLATPVITGPTDANPILKDVTLSWLSVPGAGSYDVEVGTDGQWSDTPTFSGSTGTSSLTLPVTLPHASYVWHVRAVNAQGHGAWSANGTFSRGWLDRPTLVAPIGGVALNTVPQFSWSAVPLASAYLLQVSTCPTFNDASPTTASRCDVAPTATPTASASPTDNHPTQDQTSPFVWSCYTTHLTVTPFTGVATQGEDNPGACVFSGLVPQAPLYWRVRAGDRYVGTAAITDTTPASTSGISHLPPATKPNDPNITSACPTAPSGGGSSASPSSTVTPSASPSASGAAGGGAATGCDPTHPLEFGAWSATESFSWSDIVTEGDYSTLPAITANPLPAAICPSDSHGPVCTDFPTLTWPQDCVAGLCASNYRIYVSLDAAYSNIVRIAETPGGAMSRVVSPPAMLSWTPTDDWRDSSVNRSYYYAIQPCTSEGCGAVTSRPPSFRKVTPALTQVSPVGGADASGNVQLQWQGLGDRLAQVSGSATSEASAYHLQIADADTNPSFDASGLLLDTTVDGARCANVGGAPFTDTAVQHAIESCDASSAFPASAQTNPFTGPDVMSYTTNQVLPDGNLIWRVQPVDGSGHKLPWSSAAAFVRDTDNPVVTMAPLTDVSVKPVFTVSFLEPVTGMSSSTLTLFPAVPAIVTVTSSKTATLVPTSPLAAGGSYQLMISSAVKDLSGHSPAAAGPVATVATTMDDPSPGITYRGAWGARFSSNALGGGYHRSVPTTTSQTTASARFFGTGIVVGGCAGPSNGVVDIYVDGVRYVHLDTYRSFTGCALVLGRITGLHRGFHQVQFRGVGTRSRASHGTAVGLDAFRSLP